MPGTNAFPKLSPGAQANGMTLVGQAGGLERLVRTLVLSGQLAPAARGRAPWLSAREGSSDRLVLGIQLATEKAAPRRRARKSWIM